MKTITKQTAKTVKTATKIVATDKPVARAKPSNAAKSTASEVATKSIAAVLGVKAKPVENACDYVALAKAAKELDGATKSHSKAAITLFAIVKTNSLPVIWDYLVTAGVIAPNTPKSTKNERGTYTKNKWATILTNAIYNYNIGADGVPVEKAPKVKAPRHAVDSPEAAIVRDCARDDREESREEMREARKATPSNEARKATPSNEARYTITDFFMMVTPADIKAAALAWKAAKPSKSDARAKLAALCEVMGFELA